MAISNLKKGLFIKEEDMAQKSVQVLMTLPPEERDSGVKEVLYKFCTESAEQFVQGEVQCQGSPFADLPRAHFFNEMLLINLWMIDKVFNKYKPELVAGIHQHYSGMPPDMPDRISGMARRFKTYHNEWDDYTGHQDLFGIKAGGLLFRSKNGYPVNEVSFRIISYSEESIAVLKKIRKAFREAKLIAAPDNA
ncbi:MAG: hypothetical protein EPN25_05750 [Nitrospirae bacterium]|nr:MAG: hypothetical protein EPN25_05750 [Nitrospirota bacterium]